MTTASVTLEASARGQAEKPKMLRTAGQIPGVFYGSGMTSTPLKVSHQLFRKVYAKAGDNTIIELTIDGKKHPVLVHQVQYDPVSDVVSHIDFINVDMNKEVTTTVKLSFVGVCLAVKDLGGILDIQKHELKIKCLPKDLIHSLEVDISPIVDFHTSVHVKNVVVPSTIKVLDNPEDAVVTASPQRVEVEETPAAAATPADGAAAPVAGAPGAAAPAAGAPGAAAPAAGAKK